MINNNKVNIIHLCNYIQPQLGYQEFFLAREHAAMGHDVTVVASDRYFPFPDYDNTVYPVIGDRVVGTGEMKCEGFRIIRLKTIFELGTKVWLKNFSTTIMRIKPDIVICHGMSDFNALRITILKKRMKFKLIYDDHSLFSEKKVGASGLLFYKIYPFKLIHKHGDRLVGVAEQCVDFITEIYRIPRNSLEMIPLGADSTVFRFDPDLRNKFRSKHCIKNDEIVIIYTGKLTLKKGPHNIIRAIKLLNGKIQRKPTLIFIGNMASDYKSTFEEETKQIENIARLIMIPAVKNEYLVSIYSASDIAIWPRQGSMSMIEAASCGCPIICCDFLKERYKNKNGIPIKEDDIENLAAAIKKLIENDQLRKKMGKRGRELVEAELSWKAIAKRFIN